jgi:hypothetical protein
LHAVKFWLPRKQQDDIVAELSEDIQAEIEERETALGHKLNEAEIEAILMHRGRPVLLAGRYLPQEFLIGPVLFPIYRFALKIVMLACLIPWLLTWIATLFSPASTDTHAGMLSMAMLASLLSSFLFIAFTAVASLTLVFAVLERVQAKSRFLEEWSPRKLPAVRRPNLIPRSASSIELAANLVFLVWWVSNMRPVIGVNYPELRLSLSPVWTYFYWGFLILAVANTGMAAFNLIRPFWTGARAAGRLLTDCAGSALFCWLVKANILTGISAANLSAQQAADLTTTINQALASIFPAAVLASIAITCWNVYRLIRLKAGTVRSFREALVS